MGKSGGRLAGVISEEDGLTLRLDGETVLETPLDFTYIPRKRYRTRG